ncbi:hypothetical protein NXS98_10790 [Fontisphaera persica]|uniref:hypothetical protein n=1 Tax=Fontisphaera persica TaxID=2974023 RepID=UPI0024C06501|nr:hypothetical protein [Fontisphaera persica]WCJ58211.1 hypothetical protein NXS98_10790 [Fontisphaera persica]
MMLLGGIIGFGIGIGFGLAESSPGPEALWRAAAAALVGGVLMRWWGRVWVKSLRQAHQDQAARAAAEAEEARKTETTKKP